MSLLSPSVPGTSIDVRPCAMSRLRPYVPFSQREDIYTDPDGQVSFASGDSVQSIVEDQSEATADWCKNFNSGRVSSGWFSLNLSFNFVFHLMYRRGGVRGIVSLAILDSLQKELGSELSLYKFFDMIVGTR